MPTGAKGVGYAREILELPKSTFSTDLYLQPVLEACFRGNICARARNFAFSLLKIDAAPTQSSAPRLPAKPCSARRRLLRLALLLRGPDGRPATSPLAVPPEALPRRRCRPRAAVVSSSPSPVPGPSSSPSPVPGARVAVSPSSLSPSLIPSEIGPTGELLLPPSARPRAQSPSGIGPR